MQQQSIIFFDGYCNLCSAWVSFVLKQDKQKKFLFCALQSSAAEKLLAPYNLTNKKESVILLAANNAYLKSTAALHIFKKLKSVWTLLYVFIIIPKFIRDAVYDFIAAHRYTWFGVSTNCYVPTDEEKQRFI